MNVTLVTPPAVEPISLLELKQHLRLDLDGDQTSAQTIAPGSHAITTGYGLVGTAVDVLASQATVYLESGTNQATGTVDAKIQESEDNVTWTDWTGGAFTQVTTANDNATYEKAYTGSKRYVRVVCQVLLAACEFGVSVVATTGGTIEDDLLNDIITAAREHVEDITRRALLTQTWDYFLEAFPRCDAIRLPFGNLQNSVGPPSTAPIVTYKDSAGTVTTMTADTDYLVETNGEGHGRIVLPYGMVWPSASLWPSKPITIRFVCGWTTADLVPYKIKAAMKMICSDLYNNRESQVLTVTSSAYQVNKAVANLLASCRLWGEF